MDITHKDIDDNIKEKIKLNYECNIEHIAKSDSNCNEKNINNITYFMAYELPKININIGDRKKQLTHHDIKHGKILGAGGYGFVFGFNQVDDFVLKICLCNTPDQRNTNNYEIYMNNIVFSYGNDCYIKTFGMINYDCLNKSLCITYTDLFTNIKTNYDIPKSCESVPCEKYLILEKGYKDLFYIMSDILEKKREQYNLDIIIHNYFELVSSYKISEKIIKTMNKIFINNDIKVENIMSMNDKLDTTFKLIDFGLSLLTNTFFYKNPNPFENFRGTTTFLELLYDKSVRELLYNPDNIIGTLSPLYDLFCLHCTFIQFYTLQLDHGSYKNMFDAVYRKYNLITNKKIQLNTCKILVLGLIIKNFYKQNILDKDIKKFILNKNFEIFLSKKYYIKINTSQVLPVYIDTKNKLLDDYNYFDKIVEFVLNCDDIVLSDAPIKSTSKSTSKLDPSLMTYAFY
jgi:hypothetical protein